MAREKEATGRLVLVCCVRRKGIVEQIKYRAGKKSSLNGQTMRVPGAACSLCSYV